MSDSVNNDSLKNFSGYLDKVGIDKSKLVDTKGNYYSLADIFRESDTKDASAIVGEFCDLYQDNFSGLSEDEFDEFQNIMEDALNSYNKEGSDINDELLNNFAQAVLDSESSADKSTGAASVKKSSEIPLIQIDAPRARKMSSQNTSSGESENNVSEQQAKGTSSDKSSNSVSKNDEENKSTTSGTKTDTNKDDKTAAQLSEKDYKVIYGHSADIVDKFKDLSDSEKANAAKTLAGILFDGNSTKYTSKISTPEEIIQAIKYYNQNVMPNAKGKPGPLCAVFSYDEKTLDSYVAFFKKNKDNYEAINLLIDEIKSALSYGEDKEQANRAMDFLNKVVSDKELSALVDKKLSADGGKTLSERISSRKTKIKDLPAAEVDSSENKGEKSKNYNFEHSKISSDNEVKEILENSSLSSIEKYKKIDVSLKGEEYCYEILESDNTELAQDLMEVLIAGANDNKKNKMLKTVIKHYGSSSAKIENNEFFTTYLNNKNYLNVYSALMKITDDHTETLKYMGKLSNKCINTYGTDNGNSKDKEGKSGADKILDNPSNVIELSKYGSSYVVRCMQNITMDYKKGGEVTEDKNNIAKIFESGKKDNNSHAACSVVAQSIADCIKNGDEEDKEMALDLAAKLLFHSMLGYGNTYEDMLCAIISVCDKEMFDEISSTYSLKYGSEYNGKSLRARLNEETSGDLQKLIDNRCDD